MNKKKTVLVTKPEDLKPLVKKHKPSIILMTQDTHRKYWGLVNHHPTLSSEPTTIYDPKDDLQYNSIPIIIASDDEA